MDWQWLLLAVIHQVLLKDVSCKEITIQVNPKRLIQYVPERFLSMTIDPGTILLAGNLENEALNMAKGLSPCFVRLGGKSTNYIKFGKELLMDNTTITEGQWDSVNKFASEAGMDLITSINPTERINGVWDSRDALQLISYSQKQGYNVAWQLGYDTEGISASGAEVGRDVVRLRKILDGFTKFTRSPIFAPDFPEIQNPRTAQFVRDLLIQAGPVLGAIFIQPPFKPEEDPAQTIMNTIINLDSNVWGKALGIGRMIPRKPIWIAEKDISKGGSEDAINLAKRLGVAAKIGIQVVMRQVGPETLKHPTPEYWMALMFKNLVGQGVLDVRVNSGQNRTQLHIFSHCGQSLPQDKTIIDAGMKYDKGAVTVYGVNEGTDSIKISLKVGMKEEKVHVYTLTFAEVNAKLIEETYLNGQLLTLSPEGELPIVSPRIVKRPSRVGIIIPAKSMFFFVLPDAKSRVCQTTPTLTRDVQDLSRKLIQVAAEVLDKPIMSTNIPEYEDEEQGKVYVKFNKNVNQKNNNIQKENDNDSTAKTTTDISQILDEITTPTPITTISAATTTQHTSGSTTEANIENKTASDKTRRKRSTKSSPIDMEFTPTNNQELILSQDDLVNKFNSYARKVYESSRESSAGGDLQTVPIPEEVMNTLKKFKVTFKHLESSPTKSTIDESTAEPMMKYENNEMKNNDEGNTGAEIENDDEAQTDIMEDKNEEEAIDKDNESNEYNKEKSEVKKMEKEEPDDEGDDKVDLEETIFRRPNGKENIEEEKNDNTDHTKREGINEEPDTGPENELNLISPTYTQDQPKERIPRDDSIREGKPPSESTSDGRNSLEENRDNDVGSETEFTVEPSEGIRNSEGTKSTPPVYSILRAGTPNPATATPAEDTKTPEEQKTNKKLDGSELQYVLQVPSAVPMVLDSIKEKDSDSENKEKPTSTDIPGVIAIEGVEPKKVDELLLNIAGSDVEQKDFIKTLQKSKKENTLNELQSNSIKNEDEQQDDITQNKPILLTEKIQDKNPKDEVELIDESIENKDKDEGENGSLQKGPDIPTADSPETQKVIREINSDNDEDSNNDNKPVMLLLHPSLKLPETNENIKMETDSETNKDEVTEETNKNELDDTKTNVEQEEEDEQAEEQNENLKKTKEIKVSPVASFRDVPLDNTQDKSYSPNEKSLDNKEESTENEDPEENNERPNVVAIPIQTVVVPVPSSLTSAQSPELPVSSTDSDKEVLDEEEKTKEIKENREKKKEEMARKLEILKANAEKERQDKLLAIKNQILEAREKFKALTRDDTWKSSLQRKEEETRNLLLQERELRKKLMGLPRSTSDRTLLSRPRRLTYYPEDEISREDIYDYEPDQYYQRKTDSYSLPLSEEYEKPYINQDVLPPSIRQERNHIIFPLDPKTPQAVVYNNKIIPAKLYGIINVNDGPSSRNLKSISEPPSDTFFQKYSIKSYDSANKYSPPISQTHSLKPYEGFPIPKDSFIRKGNGLGDYLPVVVVSPNTIRRKRSLSTLPYNRYLERKGLDSIHNQHVLKKRSISSKEASSKTSVISKRGIKEVTSNEIKPENIKLAKTYDFPISDKSSNYEWNQYGDYGKEGFWNSGEPIKPGEARTFSLMPPLPPLLPLIPQPQSYPPQPHRTFPLEPFQPHQTFQPGSLPPHPPQQGIPMEPPHRMFPPEPIPPPHSFHDFLDPLIPPPPPPASEKHEPEPSNAYFFNLLQDKFKSLMGMLETLAVWCGTNTSK